MNQLPLSALLSQALIAYTLEFDRLLAAKCKRFGWRRLPPSLAMWSNILRFVGERGVDQRKLPELSGISKPAVQISVACLERHGWVTVDTDPSDTRTKIVRLTPRGRKIAKLWSSMLREIDEQWSELFGRDHMRSLRTSLAKTVQRLAPPLPFYPIALPNRGGTPTGL
jgi:DNA-binding MarR family transcriptional regulator